MCNMVVIICVEDHFLYDNVALLHLLWIQRPYFCVAFEIVDGIDDVFLQSLYHSLLLLILLIVGFWLSQSGAAGSLAEGVLLGDIWSFLYCVVGEVAWSKRAIVWILASLLVPKRVEATTSAHLRARS